MDLKDKRVANEIRHGRLIANTAELIWNWSSPAGKIRFQRRCDLFKDFISGRKASILEIGCGTGLFTRCLSKNVENYFAIDVSSDLVKIAKSRIRGNHVRFVIGNAYRTPFSDKTFDYIIGSSVLHHLDVKTALSEFKRVLKINGKIMFTEPNMLNPQVFIQKNVPIIKRLAGDSPDETAFFRTGVFALLSNSGFTNVDVHPFDFLHPALPKLFIPFARRATDAIENIPFLREIAGSLIIKAEKTQ